MDVKEAIDCRIARLKAALKANSLDAILLSSPENVSYFTNFSGDDSWLLISKRKSYLITDSRYIEQAQGECVSCEIVMRKTAMTKLLSKLLARNKSIKTLAVEPSMSVGVFDNLKESLQAQITVSTGIVENLRQIKDKLEIPLIIAAGKKAKTALANALLQITPAITERQLAGLIEFEMSKLLVVPSFETVVAFGANGSRPHHSPSSKRLKQNDTILIDFGVRYKGYCCDITRCFGVGKVSDQYRRAYEAVIAAQAAAISKVSPNAAINQADKAAREAITAFNLPDYGHSTGHGIGLKVHESPTVYSSNEQNFQPGQVVTIEPGVYISGKLGIRIEDDVLVTKTGSKLLTRSKQSPKLEILHI